MRGTWLSNRVIWAIWAVVAAGAMLANVDGFAAPGIAVWLTGVSLQWILGITVLVRRRRAPLHK